MNIQYTPEIGSLVTSCGKNIGIVMAVDPIVITALSTIDYHSNIELCDLGYMFSGRAYTREESLERVSKFCTEGTAAGDWQLPSLAEMRQIKANIEVLDEAFFQHAIAAYNTPGQKKLFWHFRQLSSAIKDDSYRLRDVTEHYVFRNDSLVPPYAAYEPVLPKLKLQ